MVTIVLLLFVLVGNMVEQEPILVKFTPEVINAIFGGLGSLIVAMTGLFIAVWNLRKKTTEVHSAVNGANTALLAKIDRLTTRVADLTGRKSDIIESVAAHDDVMAKNDLNLTPAAPAKVEGTV